MKKYDIHQDILFQSGVYSLNKEKNFDFQLNRLINWDGGRLEDVQKIASNIKNSADWKRELIRLGDEALSDGRTENAIGYYRMSEFFMYDGDVDKKKYYTLATNLFYEYFSDFFAGENPVIERYDVPYKKANLPVWHLKPKGDSKGLLLFHGGNDSYFEELLFPVLYLREKGFEIYLFEGPGQGGVIRIQNLHFTHRWEKPVKAILDYFQLENVTIIGISLGGYLAPRAAAFDSRITKVVAWSIFPCFLDVILGTQKPILQKAFRFLMKFHAKPILNFVFYQKAKNDPMIDWGLKHGMYAYEASDPYTYAQKLKLYDLKPIAHKITQDMLIIGANQDHFINYQMIGSEISMLKNVRSLTFRLFTEKENAQNHCNVGNVKLVLDEICEWMEKLNNSHFKSFL